MDRFTPRRATPMKRFLVINSSSDRVGHGTLDEIRRVVPRPLPPASVDWPGTVQVRLPDHSPECQRILRILTEAGCTPHIEGTSLGSRSFVIQPNYEYEAEDLERAACFEVLSAEDARTHDQAEPTDGSFALEAQGLQAKGPLLAAGDLLTLVSSQLRADMEAAGFVGLAFRPVRAYTGKHPGPIEEVSWGQIGCQPYWVITPTLTLPRLSRRCDLRDASNQPVTGEDSSRGGTIQEREFPAGELHYVNQEIKQVAPFDFAATRELLAFGRSPRLVVSRRVHEFLIARGVEALWLPVFVDDE